MISILIDLIMTLIEKKQKIFNNQSVSVSYMIDQFSGGMKT